MLEVLLVVAWVVYYALVSVAGLFLLEYAYGYQKGKQASYYFNWHKTKFFSFAYDKGYRNGRKRRIKKSKKSKKSKINWGEEYEKKAHEEGILSDRYRG